MREERKEKLMNMFHTQAPIARYFGMRMSFSEDGSAIVELPYNPNLDHGWVASTVVCMQRCLTPPVGLQSLQPEGTRVGW
jgi:hypothetical protein